MDFGFLFVLVHVLYGSGDFQLPLFSRLVYHLAHVPCTTYHVPCTMYHVPCTMYHVPCTKYLSKSGIILFALILVQ
jgi:hypothetical protein